MEKMSFRKQTVTTMTQTVVARSTEATTSDWKQALPVLTGSMVTLRELRLSDAPSLLAMLSQSYNPFLYFQF